MREAKLHTSWDQPNPIYEGAVNHFANGVMRSRRFMSELEEFVEKVRHPGPVQFPRPQIADAHRRPGCPTCTRAASCGTFRSSTRTTAGRSITRPARRCSAEVGVGRPAKRLGHGRRARADQAGVGAPGTRDCGRAGPARSARGGAALTSRLSALGTGGRPRRGLQPGRQCGDAW